MTKWKPSLKALLPVAVAIAACYSNIYHCPFVYDDLPYIDRNVFLRSASHLGDLWHFAPTRFLTYFSLFLNYQFFGSDVVSYHVVNILIHVVNAVLLYFLTYTLLSLPGFSGISREKLASSASHSFKEQFSFFISLIFAIHPIQTEAVTYTWQRGASLAALFYIASLLCYARSALVRSKRLLWASFLFAILAMFTKQIAATLPVAILLIEYFGMGWDRSQRLSRQKRLIPLLLTFLVIPLTMLLVGDYDWSEIHSTIPTAVYIPARLEYLLTEINVVRDYYRLLLFPLTQMVDYDVPWVHSFLRLDILLSLVWHLGVLGVAFKLRKRLPLFSFGIFFFYLALSVESSIVPLADVEFEHRLYLPSFGFFLALGSLGHYGATHFFKIKPINQQAYVSLLLFVMAPLAFLTWKRNQVWGSTESFWRDAALKSPNKSRTLTSYGRILQTKGEKEEAIKYLERAAQLDPKNTLAELSLALQYAQTGQLAKAFLATERMGVVSKDLPEYNYAMGGIQMMNGNIDQALEFLKRAVSEKSLATDSPDSGFVKLNAYEHIVQLAMDKGYHAQAIDAGKKLLEMDPSRNDIRTKIAFLMAKRGNFADAEEQYTEILRDDPNNFSTYNNLAILMEKEKKIDKAEAFFRQAMTLRPTDAAPQINLIMLLTENGKPEQAREAYLKLPDLGPEGWKPYAMIGRNFFDKGYCDLALDPMEQVLRRSSENHLLVEMHSKLAECYSRLGNRDLASEHSSLARKFSK